MEVRAVYYVFLVFLVCTVALGGLTQGVASSVTNEDTEAPLPAGEDMETPSAEMTLELTGDPWSICATDRKFAVMASGEAPQSSVSLLDDHGEGRGTISLKDEAACVDAEERFTGLGSNPWCLSVEGAQPGHEAVATLEGASSILKVTVKAKVGAVWPWVASLAFVIIGAVLTYRTTRIPDKINRKRLCELANHMESQEGWTGVVTWTESQIPSADPMELYRKLRILGARGKGQDEAARAALTKRLEAIDRDQLGDGIKAEIESVIDKTVAEPAIIDIGNFYKKDGTAAIHKATLFLPLVRMLGEISALIAKPGSAAEDMRTELDGWALYKDLENLTEYDLEDLADIRDRFWQSIWGQRQVDQAAVRTELERASSSRQIGIDTVRRARTPAYADIDRWHRRPPVCEPLIYLWIVVAASGAMIVTYYGSTTFGTLLDWAKLAAASLGASAVATIAGVLTKTDTEIPSVN